MKIIIVPLVTLLLLAACNPSGPQSIASTAPASADPAASAPAPASATAVSSPTLAATTAAATQASQMPIARGVNFGNALEAPNEGEWGVTLDEGLFDAVVEAGFDTLRLPVRWSAHALNEPPYTIEPQFFARVDWAIENATRRGLTIIVNMHHYEELMADPSGQRQRFVALWQQIAERYRDQPASVIFELCNEPTMPAEQWNMIMREALAVVRVSNPDRLVVIGGVDWNGISGLSKLELPADDRQIIATFHYYGPFQFTHQGAEWVEGSQAWVGSSWSGTEAEIAEIRGHLDEAVAWASQHERPLLLGEFGAYQRADPASRVRWTSFLAREAEARGIAWTYWEFAAGFGIYNRADASWNMPLREALIP